MYIYMYMYPDIYICIYMYICGCPHAFTYVLPTINKCVQASVGSLPSGLFGYRQGFSFRVHVNVHFWSPTRAFRPTWIVYIWLVWLQTGLSVTFPSDLSLSACGRALLDHLGTLLGDMGS